MIRRMTGHQEIKEVGIGFRFTTDGTVRAADGYTMASMRAVWLAQGRQ